MARYGVYRGIVTNDADPEGLGRLKAQIPQVFGPLESAWAWPAVPNIGGMVPPAIGNTVWIAFEGGHPDKPVWIGTWSKVGEELPPLPSAGGSGGGADETLQWMMVNP